MRLTFPINISWKIITEWNGFSIGPYNFRPSNIPKNLSKLTEFTSSIFVTVVCNNFISPASGSPFKQEDIPIRVINSVTGNNVTAGYRYTPDAFIIENGVLVEPILKMFQQNKYAFNQSESDTYLSTNYIVLNGANYFCGKFAGPAASIVYPHSLGSGFNITTDVNDYFASLTQSACQMAKQLHKEYHTNYDMQMATAIIGTVVVGGIIACGIFARNRAHNHLPPQPLPLAQQAIALPPQPAAPLAQQIGDPQDQADIGLMRPVAG